MAAGLEPLAPKGGARSLAGEPYPSGRPTPQGLEFLGFRGVGWGRFIGCRVWSVEVGFFRIYRLRRR